MIALLLAATLFGPPAPAQHSVTPAEPIVSVALADRMADHAWYIGMGTAVDLTTTGLCRWRNPRCYEANGLIKNDAMFVGMALGGSVVALSGSWKLERDGHEKAAKIVSRGWFISRVVLGGWATYNAFWRK